MQLDDVLNKSCLIGLAYYGVDGNVLKRAQYAGQVVEVDAEKGILVALRQKISPQQNGSQVDTLASDKADIFVLPASLAPWFKAPAGVFRDDAGELLIENPDYLVTWAIYQRNDNKADGEHGWWEWQPITASPSVGN